MNESPALEVTALGRRYGANWALRDCTLTVPAGSVTALVGPNGAGKTTLLQLAVGLIEPDSGSIRVLGHDPRAEPLAVLPRVGFVAQDHPLPRRFTIGETLRLGRELNGSWDDAVAERRVDELGLSRRQRVGTLSGGQQAQVALTLALAKRPQLLLLDEPVASLDPLARREFLTGVLQAVIETGITVVLSSHIVADLERICDRLIILANGRTQLVGPIDEILAGHRLLTGPRTDAAAVARAPPGDPREPHGAADDAARASARARLRRGMGDARGRSRGDRARLSRCEHAPLVPTCRRRWPDDLGRLASAARRDADRGRDARRARRNRDPDRRPHCVCLYARRSRRLRRKRQSGRLRCLGRVVPLALQRPEPSVHVVVDSFRPWRRCCFAAPFVLDLDSGTYRLYWTQSITRRRWIVTKLTFSLAASVAVAACLVALATWSRAPLDHLNGRMSINAYDTEGIVPIAYALFVLGVAVAIGALWRRTVPALLVAFAVYVVGRAVHGQLAAAAAALARQDDLARERERSEPEPGPGDQPVRQHQERTAGSRAGQALASEVPALSSRIRAFARSPMRAARTSM